MYPSPCPEVTLMISLRAWHQGEETLPMIQRPRWHEADLGRWRRRRRRRARRRKEVGRRKWPDDLWSRVTAGLVDHAKIRYELRKRTTRFLPVLWARRTRCLKKEKVDVKLCMISGKIGDSKKEKTGSNDPDPWQHLFTNSASTPSFAFWWFYRKTGCHTDTRNMTRVQDGT